MSTLLHYCEYCPSSFPRREHLERHKRKHTGEKPFICTDCGKGFTRMDNMRDHQRRHQRKGYLSLQPFLRKKKKSLLKIQEKAKSQPQEGELIQLQSKSELKIQSLQPQSQNEDKQTKEILESETKTEKNPTTAPPENVQDSIRISPLPFLPPITSLYDNSKNNFNNSYSTNDTNRCPQSTLKKFLFSNGTLVRTPEEIDMIKRIDSFLNQSLFILKEA